MSEKKNEHQSSRKENTSLWHRALLGMNEKLKIKKNVFRINCTK